MMMYRSSRKRRKPVSKKVWETLSDDQKKAITKANKRKKPKYVALTKRTFRSLLKGVKRIVRRKRSYSTSRRRRH